MALAAVYAYHWQLWELQHKAIFDGLTRTIRIGLETTDINVKVDLYSAWKEWAMAAENMKWVAAMRSTGGDPIPGRFLGATFFLINGWRIIIDHPINFDGNLYTEEGVTPFITDPGQEVSTTTVSNLVDLVELPATVVANEIAQSTWDLSTTNITPGSMGEALVQLRDSRILLNTKTVAGSTTSALKVAATGIATGFYDQHFVQLIEGTNSIVREIETYNTNGTITVNIPFPFAPGLDAQVYILADYLVGSGRVF